MTKEILKALLKIQELELILRESDIVHHQGGDSIDSSKEDLERQIKEMKKGIPHSLLRQFESVRRNGIGIAAEQGGRCRACHMTIPIGTLNAMKQECNDVSCPNCGVLLYLECFSEEK